MTTAASPTAAPAASFALALPVGWARLPARAEQTAQLAREVDRIVREALPDDLPRDRAEPLRRQLRRRLTDAVEEAGRAGANAVYLPASIDGFALPVSLSEAEVDDESETEPVRIVADLLSDAGQLDGLRDVDGAAAARTAVTIASDQAEGSWERTWSRRVVYTISVPHRPGRWVVLTWSAVYGDEPSERLADALVELFDSIMTTFRWTDVPGEDPTPVELAVAAAEEAR